MENGVLGVFLRPRKLLVACGTAQCIFVRSKVIEVKELGTRQTLVLCNELNLRSLSYSFSVSEELRIIWQVFMLPLSKKVLGTH